MTVKELPVFILTAQKRAVRAPAGVSKSSRKDWIPDEEGFKRRWGDRRPDIGVQRSKIAQPLIDQATRLNEAQLDQGYLDWLFVVDVDVPVHTCWGQCPGKELS